MRSNGWQHQMTGYYNVRTLSSKDSPRRKLRSLSASLCTLTTKMNSQHRTASFSENGMSLFWHYDNHVKRDSSFIFTSCGLQRVTTWWTTQVIKLQAAKSTANKTKWNSNNQISFFSLNLFTTYRNILKQAFCTDLIVMRHSGDWKSQWDPW